jgi:hypothetical protein
MQMKGMNMALEVKTIGSSGQISFGKQHAGQTVTVEEIEKGVWLVKAARVIPENELWLHSPSARRTLDRAVAWAAANPPRVSDLNKLEAKLKKRR